jgi:hypothetical protein
MGFYGIDPRVLPNEYKSVERDMGKIYGREDGNLLRPSQHPKIIIQSPPLLEL